MTTSKPYPHQDVPMQQQQQKQCHSLTKTTTTTDSNILERLPRDVWVDILDYLPLYKLSSVLCVSKTIYSIIHHNDVFERICRTMYPPTTLHIDAYHNDRTSMDDDVDNNSIDCCWKSMLLDGNGRNGLRVRSLPSRVHETEGFSMATFRSSLCWDSYLQKVYIRLRLDVTLRHNLGHDGAIHLLNLSRETLKNTTIYRYPQQSQEGDDDDDEEERNMGVDVDGADDVSMTAIPTNDHYDEDSTSGTTGQEEEPFQQQEPDRRRHRDGQEHNDDFIRLKPLASYFEVLQRSRRFIQHTFLFVFHERDILADHHYILHHHGIFSGKPFLNPTDFTGCYGDTRRCDSDEKISSVPTKGSNATTLDGKIHPWSSSPQSSSSSSHRLYRLFDVEHQNWNRPVSTSSSVSSKSSSSSSSSSTVCKCHNMIPRHGKDHTTVWKRNAPIPDDIQQGGYHWIRSGCMKHWE